MPAAPGDPCPPTVTCPKCSFAAPPDAIRCPRCNALLLMACSGSCAGCAKSCAARKKT